MRREVEIEGEPFTIVVTRQGVRITRKRFRHGRTISWRALWESGELDQADDDASE
jgi:hypothetical protein